MALNDEQIREVVMALNHLNAFKSESGESISVFSKDDIDRFTVFCEDEDNKNRVFWAIEQMEKSNNEIAKIPNVELYKAEVLLPAMENVLKKEAINLAENLDRENDLPYAKKVGRYLARIGDYNEAEALQAAFGIDDLFNEQFVAAAEARPDIIDAVSVAAAEASPEIDAVSVDAVEESPRKDRRKQTLSKTGAEKEEIQADKQQKIDIIEETAVQKQRLKEQLAALNSTQSQATKEYIKAQIKLAIISYNEMLIFAEEMIDTFAKGSAKQIAKSAADLKVTIMKARDDTIKLFSRGFEDVSDHTMKAFGDLQRNAYGAFKVFSQVVYDAKEKFLDTATTRVTVKEAKIGVKHAQNQENIKVHKDKIKNLKKQLKEGSLGANDEAEKKKIEEEITGLKVQIAALSAENYELAFAETIKQSQLLKERAAGLDARVASQDSANKGFSDKRAAKVAERSAQDVGDAKKYAQIRDETFKNVKQTLRDFGAKVGGSNKAIANAKTPGKDGQGLTNL